MPCVSEKRELRPSLGGQKANRRRERLQRDHENWAGGPSAGGGNKGGYFRDE